jgi:hypothetical protein
MRVINLVGSLTASILMFLLLKSEAMTEIYFGIYLGAVGLTAVGYKFVANNGNGSAPKE